MKRYAFIIPLFVMAASCAHVISGTNLETAMVNVPFREVQGHIDEYLGKKFIFGGIIADIINTKAGGEIEVVQTPIDRWGNVVAQDVSDGRFIVRTEKHIDPFIFRTGKEITISGMLVETQKKMLSGGEETYPVFEAAEIRLRPDDTYYRYPVWREPLYIPYPYYWYDPFWSGPFFYP